MAKKYIKKSVLVEGEQFRVSVSSSWPTEIEQNIESPTGYYYCYEKIDGLKEEGYDPVPKTLLIKIPISNNDYFYIDENGKHCIESEAEFNNSYEEK